MNVYFKADKGYYSGFQKFNLLRDRTFRGCIIVFFILVLMHIPSIVAISPGKYRDLYFILVFLIYVYPAAFIVAGGMPAAGWMWYGFGAAFFAIATIPIAFGASYFFLLFIIPTLFCMAITNGIAPHLLASLGYKTRPKPLIESIFAVLIAAVLCVFTWMGQALIRKNSFQILSAPQYIWYVATGVLYYGILFGILYGMLMRRLLDMRYEIWLPMALNAVLMSSYWIPSAIGYSTIDMQMVAVGVALQSFTSQTTFCLSFFFCRSSRPLLAAYVMYYLFLKSALF